MGGHVLRYLKKELAQKVGRAGDFTVWFDTINLRGNHNLTPEITAQLRGAATFVAILSPPYAASRWCRDEAAHCTDRSANRGAEGSAMTTGSGSPDCSPATGADEAPQ